MKSILSKINLPFDLSSVRPECIECILDQVEKYKNFADSYGKSLFERFVVPCQGILREPIDPSLKSMFSPGEWDMARSVVDPVVWAEQHVTHPDGEPWIARDYQARVMRCTSNRRVLRISRRTGKTDMVSVEITYQMFTKKGIRILVGGPQKVHVEEIINRIRGFIYRNPLLADEVVHDVSSPIYQIELKSGSYVKGFALGTKGKTQGVGVRGQNADRIYCDEMDYVDDNAVIGGLLPIIQTTPETSMTGFSTPSGFKSVYYRMCEEDPYYKEFKYNYKVLPHWKVVERDRGSYTEEKWTHEMLAEWGSSESGVYRPSYIDRSMRVYDYEGARPMPGWRYVIGADWNEKYGAQIVVVGENLSGGYYQVVEAIGVEKSEFTQLSSVQSLIDTVKKWRPSSVYVDAGNGSTNYELLKKMSYDQRMKHGDYILAGLIDILKKYDSGASIQTKDPVTGQPIKAPAKSYMINASVRAFESDRVRISATDKELEQGLRNYIIERISPSGTPIYGMRDTVTKDHRLDAFHLAMVSFFIEYGGLSLNTSMIEAVATVNPITKKMGESRITPSTHRQDPSERRLEEAAGKGIISSIGLVLPGRVDNGYTIGSNRPGWATDEEQEYEQRNLRRKIRGRNLGGGPPIRRTNI
jgi:hypothetical protein